MIDRACISINNRCNLRCKYCHFLDKETNQKMDFDCAEVELIIDNIAAYCKEKSIAVFKLGIVGAGEPLLSFNALAAIVNRVRNQGYKMFQIYTITNGVELTDEQLDFFKQNRDIIELNFSLDGYEELHNTYRQKFCDTLSAIFRYEKLFGHKPKINCTVSKQSTIHSDRLIAFFIENNFNNINFSIISGVSDKELVISQSEYDLFLDKCETAGISMRQRNKTPIPIYDCAMYGKLCGVGRTNIFFTHNGVYPCGRFFGLEEYRIAEFSENLNTIEAKLDALKKVPDGKCYYETFVNQSKEK